MRARVAVLVGRESRILSRVLGRRTSFLAVSLNRTHLEATKVCDGEDQVP